MDPLDFLAVADRLKCSSDEAERRTAVSRAYYSVFNYLKAYLVKHSVPVSSSASGHTELACYLRNSGIGKAKTLSQMVDDLRAERNKADYKMRLRHFSKGTCSLLFDKAEKVIRDFDSCKGSILINGINNYRKTIGEA